MGLQKPKPEAILSLPASEGERRKGVECAAAQRELGKRRGKRGRKKLLTSRGRRHKMQCKDTTIRIVRKETLVLEVRDGLGIIDSITKNSEIVTLHVIEP